MDNNFCANCFMHGWRQVEDKSVLQRCKQCKLIFYCSKECQGEHWYKVHKKHCKHFKDPKWAEHWQNSLQDCSLCQQMAVVDQAKVSANVNYGCFIFNDQTVYSFTRLTQTLNHPYPYPITGQKNETLEKAIAVLQHLLFKMQTKKGFKAQVPKDLQNKLAKVSDSLLEYRFIIWKVRKIFPAPNHELMKHEIMLKTIIEESMNIQATSEAFNLMTIIKLICQIIFDVRYLQGLESLNDLPTGLPEEIQSLMMDGVANSSKYLDMVNVVLEASSNKDIAYQDILRLKCEDGLKKGCTFCSDESFITDLVTAPNLPEVFLDILFVRMQNCDGVNCGPKVMSRIQDRHRFRMAVLGAVAERQGNECDYCFKLPPTVNVHRCAGCFAVRYCSKTCKDKDWDIHKIICKDNIEERKRKGGGTFRRKMARKGIETLENKFSGIDLVSEVLGPIKEQMKTKKTKK